MVGAEETHRLVHRHVAGQAAALQLHPDQVAQLAWLAAGIHAEDRQAAVVGLANSLQAFQRGRLARAVGAEQAEDFAPVGLEADAVDRDEGSVALAEVLD